MSLARAIIQTVESVSGFLSPDQMHEEDLQQLANALNTVERAVRHELLERIVARCGRLPVSHPWPEEADPTDHPIVQRVFAKFRTDETTPPRGPSAA